GIPGTRKTRAKAAPLPTGAAAPARPVGAESRAAALAEGGTAAVADAAARSLSRSPFATPRRGKPRFLGLILTAILLLCLALVAVWSSLYLASSGRTEEETSFAAAGDAAVAGSTPAADPAIEDEMLADAQDPADFAQPDAPPADPPLDTALAETAPATDAPVTDSETAPEATTALAPEDAYVLSTADAPPPALGSAMLPEPSATAEASPDNPMPPPPYGMVYAFDDDGLIVPTPAGIPSPDGYMIYAGAPPLVPPTRSPVAEAAAEAARLAEAEAEAAEAEARAAEEAAAAAETSAPAQLVEALPLSPPSDEPATHPAEQPDPELAAFRPRPRPDSLAVPQAAPAAATPGEDDDALLAPAAPPADGEAVVQFASLVPPPRPAHLETAAAASPAAESLAVGVAAARNETAAASLVAPQAETALAAEEAANPALLAISLRPAQKPKDFSRAVEAAVAAAIRAPEPAPAAAPPAARTAAAKAPEIKPEEQDEIDEPEVAATPAPKIPTKASVAKQATFTKAINLSRMNLIGVYGTQSNRYALVRLANGKYQKVKIGDRLDGGRVEAITQSELRYKKGSKLIALPMPKG
ncbi:translation initiation factor 2, partial [Rhodobacteraceae bacterium PA1-206B]